MPGKGLVAVEHVLQAARRVRPRSGVYVLLGLAVSGWLGFLVLAGILLAKLAAAPPSAPLPVLAALPSAGEALQCEVAQAEPASKPKSTPAPEPSPPRITVAPQLVLVLAAFEDRRRIQWRMWKADTIDYEDLDIAAARSIYAHAAALGWAEAALALAFTYDPHELKQRAGVTVAPDPVKARACYIKARE